MITEEEIKRLAKNVSHGNYAQATKYFVPLVYRVHPELIPFSGGDRAKLLGKEDAQTFALRKWGEQTEREIRSGTRTLIAMRKRAAAKQAEQLPTNAEMHEAMHVGCVGSD